MIFSFLLRKNAGKLQRIRCKAYSSYQAPTKVLFYYDTLCPHSWCAFEVLMRYRPVWNLDITFKPVSLPAMTNDTIVDTLRNSPNRRDYFFRDLVRAGDFFKVPIRLPESPFYLFGVAGTRIPQQFLCVIQLRYPELLERASREVWYRIWSEDMESNTQTSLMLLGLRSGLTDEKARDLVMETDSSRVKDLLRKNTEEAVENGAYGVPYLSINPEKRNAETFYGVHQFETMAHRLGKSWNGPMPPLMESTELKPPPSFPSLSIKEFDDIQKTQLSLNPKDP